MFGKGKGPNYGKAPPGLSPPTPVAGPYRESKQPELMPGDWICPKCGDHQFARNWFCKMCAKQCAGGGDPMAAMMAMMMTAGLSSGKGGNQVKGDPQLLVYVGNIDWKAQLPLLCSLT